VRVCGRRLSRRSLGPRLLRRADGVGVQRGGVRVERQVLRAQRQGPQIRGQLSAR